MISQTVEYALRAVVFLADCPTRQATTKQIARATQVPASYMSKVLQELAKSGLLRSQRGLHGGFELARPSNEVTVLDVVNAIEPTQRIRACPLNRKEHGHGLCPLHKRLDEAFALVEEAFAQTTVSELLEPSEDVRQCFGTQDDLRETGERPD